MLNQLQSLLIYILDGRIEISNNLCEQRMKPIKLELENCQNIGSEEVAAKAAFMHSIFESCSLNKIRSEEYLTNLFKCLGQKNIDKVALLPCSYTKKILAIKFSHHLYYLLIGCFSVYIFEWGGKWDVHFIHLYLRFLELHQNKYL